MQISAGDLSNDMLLKLRFDFPAWCLVRLPVSLPVLYLIFQVEKEQESINEGEIQEIKQDRFLLGCSRPEVLPVRGPDRPVCSVVVKTD